jgi:hypothetical protein
MTFKSWWMVLVLVAACGGDDPYRERVSEHLEPGTGEAVVIALIEAFQAGDQERVEALWARDGGTWRDAEGFRARAAPYQSSEFDLDPESITINYDHGLPQVVVRATQDGQDYIWGFFVSEFDGVVRAGGVVTRAVGPSTAGD